MEPGNIGKSRQLAMDVWQMLLASCRRNAMDEHEDRIKEILAKLKGTEKTTTSHGTVTMAQVGNNNLQIKEISGGNVTFNLGGKQ
jgi:hypothetical protein